MYSIWKIQFNFSYFQFKNKLLIGSYTNNTYIKYVFNNIASLTISNNNRFVIELKFIISIQFTHSISNKLDTYNV